MKKIKEIKHNCMGTLDLIAQFNGMRKTQSFIVYPMQKDDSIEKIRIQSDTRIGYIFLDSGDVVMSPSIQSGAYNPHLIFAKKIDQINAEELAGLKFRLFQTAGDKVGANGMHIFCDNSKAAEVSIF